MNSSDPPPPAASADRRDADPVEVAALAARLGIDLPPECVAGVGDNLALLDRHWTELRAFVPPPA